MDKKLFYIAIFLIFSFFMSSCNTSSILPSNEETEIISVINNYAEALNNQNWNGAKSYCVYNSFSYQMVDLYEIYVVDNNVEAFVYKIDKIKDIDIDNSYAQADIHIVSTLGSWHEDIYLQKVNGIWKIYNNSYAWY